VGRLTLVLLPLFTHPPLKTALGGEVAARASPGGSWSQWSSHEWTHSTTSTASGDYADRPSEKALTAIAVEWQEPQRDALGNLCIIRGRLMTPGDGQAKPVDWLQGVTVYLAKVPGAKPNWSAGMDQSDTLSKTAVVSPAGEFEVRIDMRKTQQDRTRPQPFQFGLALAEHTELAEKRQRIVWTSHAPAIAATVRMLDIPAAAKLSRELDLINRASGWPFSNPNGVDLIRAVNALQRLGKQQALATLEEYVEATNSYDYSGEQDIVFWIIRCLFEPIRLDERIPIPAIAVHLEESANWPLNPIAIVDDIPFMIGMQIGMGGAPEPPSAQIKWARRHGVVRDRPLKPTANPLLAARAILGSQAFLQLDRSSRTEATRLLRLQAMSMVADALPPELTRHDEHTIERRQWRALIQDAQARPIRWDVDREQFVEKAE
jgi:hypothetical protein